MRALASLARFWILVRRERIELLRDGVSLAIIVLLPLVTLVLFTFALATDVKNMPLAVFDGADTTRSRAIVQSIRATGYFDVRRAPSLREAREGLARGEVTAVITIPPDVEARFARGEVAEAELLLDGSQALLAANAEAILRACVGAFDPLMTVRPVRRAAVPAEQAGGLGHPVAVQRALFNPRLDSEHFMIPGLLGYIFTFLTILVAAVAIVRERTIGTFEQLLVTPVAPGEIIAAKLFVLGIAMLADELLVVFVGGAWFGVWPRGSLGLLLGSTVLYLLVTLSIGLLISATSKTPVDAIQKAVVTATPLLNVSGLVFPVASMPHGFQVLANALPVSHYMQVCRGIYLSGAGLGDVLGDLGVIAAWLVLLTALLRRRLARERGA